MNRVNKLWRRFVAAEQGVVTAEMVICLPLLLWTFMALFTFWDGYRTRNLQVKAGYVIADMLSRENRAINGAYIQGMQSVYRYMSGGHDEGYIRVTSVKYTETHDRYEVLWSRSTQATKAPVLTTNDLVDIRDRLPLVADQDTLLVVETWRGFTPVFNVGLSGQLFHEYALIRPRFLSPLPMH